MRPGLVVHVQAGAGGGTLTPYGLTWLGTGDGTNRTFNLPASNMSGVTLLVGAIPQPASTWSLSVGTGPGGVDQVVFGEGNAPSDGDSVEFTGFSS